MKIVLKLELYTQKNTDYFFIFNFFILISRILKNN